MNKILLNISMISSICLVSLSSFAEDLSSFYAPRRTIQVEINTAQWDKLRFADPVGGRCNFGFIGDRYQYESFEEVRVNGVSYANVGAKKKSWCGSENKDKPSLNLKFDKFDKASGKAAKANMGTDALTLNNSLQDPSFLRQCLSYEMFRKAGIAAPLCNYAHVRVNGFDMGLYVNLQPLKKPFFRENFEGELGNSYEFALENLEWQFLPRLEAGLDSMKETEDKSLADLRSVIEALDSGEMSRIDQVVDVDQFLRFWAMEMVLSHSDGLTLANNNAHAYFPENGKMQMIPWGTDQILRTSEVREARSLYLGNRLAARLSRDPESYARLMSYLVQYRNDWNPDAIIAEINAEQAAVQWVVRDWERGGFFGAVEGLRHHVRSRVGEMMSFTSASVVQPKRIANASDLRMCLNSQDMSGRKLTNVWGCAEHPDQLWQLSSLGGDWVQIRNPARGNCVNVQGSGEGQPVGSWSCDVHPDQTWKVINADSERRMFESQRAPGKCLSLSRSVNGSDPVLKTCNMGDATQVWQIAP